MFGMGNMSTVVNPYAIVEDKKNAVVDEAERSQHGDQQIIRLSTKLIVELSVCSCFYATCGLHYKSRKPIQVPLLPPKFRTASKMLDRKYPTELQLKLFTCFFPMSIRHDNLNFVTRRHYPFVRVF